MVGLVVPILATQVAKVEYKLLFALCALISLLGLILLNRWVLEPRWTNNIEK
jgi:ABC-type Fe3+-siderophore transport system permease subunit